MAWSALNVRRGRPRGRRYARWGARRRRAGAVSSADGQAQPRLLPRRIGARGLLRPRAEKPAYAGRIIIGQQRLISSPEHRALRFPCAQRARGQRRAPGSLHFIIRASASASISVCNKYIRLTVSTAPGGACARACATQGSAIPCMWSHGSSTRR